MHWGRKVALLILTAVVLWTTMPASACVLMMQSNARPVCCGEMAQGGAMRGMRMHPTCCRIRGTEPAVTPVPPFSPEHSLKPLLVAYSIRLERPAATDAGWHSALEAPPPRSSPGALSILRI
jgi:hypothetical protein